MDRRYILVVNAGSSSIKFTLFDVSTSTPRKQFDGTLTGIGWESGRFEVDGARNGSEGLDVVMSDHHEAGRYIVEWLGKHIQGNDLIAIGHRIVHGGPYFSEPVVIDDDIVMKLHTMTEFDPSHMSDEIALIDVMREHYSNCVHVACFDTSFHHDMPRVAQLMAIPRQYQEKGIRRYGFHGLSCEYIIAELSRESVDEANGKVIVAHLGNGASITAIHHGKSIDTTMALTPAAGIPMSTRSGDIDPGIVRYLASKENMSLEDFDDMVINRSGLQGLSGSSADMETLLKDEVDDTAAADAVNLFCYQAAKSIGALGVALGGIDTIIFTGGIGENAPKIRARIAEKLSFLGVEMSIDRNEHGEAIFSTEESKVKLRMMHTEESETIVKDVLVIIQKGGHDETENRTTAK